MQDPSKSVSGNESPALPEGAGADTPDPAFDRALDVLLTKTPEIDPETGHLDRYDRGSALQCAFADRLGLRDAALPYQPKPPKFYDDNRADRRRRRRRAQILRSYMRSLFRDGV
jgi:hypothetical protein